jgi:hypothetical protein
MARTIPAVITEARKLLKDTRPTSQRYTDEHLIGVLNSAFGEIYRLRPDVTLGCCEDAEVPQYETADATDNDVEFPLENQFFQPVVWFIVATIELSDDEFTLEGRAQSLLNGFRQALIGPGG